MVGKSSKAAPAERPTGRRTRNHPTASPLAHLSPVKRVRKTPKKVAKPAIDDAPAPPPQVAAAAQPATSPSQSPQPGESDSASHHVAESRSTTPPDQHANITRASRSATPHITAPKGKGKEKEAAPSPATKSRADRYASRGEPSTHQGVGPSKRTAKRTYKQAVDVSEDDEDTAGEQRRAKRTRVEHQTPSYNSPRPSTRQGAGPSEVATPQPAVTEDTETASRTFSRLDAESVGEEQPTTSSYKSPQSQAYSTPRAAGHSTENSDIDTSEQRPAATGTPNTAKTPVPSTSTQKTPTPAPEPLPIDPVERERVIEKRWGKLPQRNPESSIRNRFANLENVRESIELYESDEENGEAYTKEDHARFKKDFRLAERNMRAVMRREDPLLAPKSAMMSVTRKMNRKQGSQPASEKSMNDPSPIAFTLAAGTPGTQVVTVNNPKLQETLLTIAQWADRKPGSALPSEQETLMWLDARNQLAVSPASRTPTARKQIMQPTPKQPTPKQPTPKQSTPRQPSPQHSRAAATPLPAEESELDDSSVHSSDSEDDGVRTPVEHREVQATEEADTPVQQTPARHEPAPWSMFSAVKSLVSTPFTGFFGRSQHNAATITNGAASETANASRIPATPTPSAGRSFNKVKSQSERRRKGPQGFKRPVPQTERRRRVVEKQPIHLRGSEFSRADEFESQTQRARKQHRDATTAQAAEEGPSRRAHPNTFRVPSPTSSENSDDEEVEKNGSQSTSNTPSSHVSEHTGHFSHLLLRINEDFCHGSSVTSSSTTSNSKVSVGGSNQDPLSTDASSSSQPRELVRMDTMEFSAPYVQYIGDNRSDITGKTSLSNDSQIHWPGLETLYQSPFAKLSDEEISKAWEHVRWNEPTALRLFKEMYYKAVSCIPRNSVDLAGKLLSKKDYKVKLTRRYVFLCDYYANAFWPPYTSFADNVPSKKLALIMLQGLLDLDNKDREAAVENGHELVQTYAQADVRGVLGLRAYDYNSKPSGRKHAPTFIQDQAKEVEYSDTPNRELFNRYKQGVANVRNDALKSSKAWPHVLSHEEHAALNLDAGKFGARTVTRTGERNPQTRYHADLVENEITERKGLYATLKSKNYDPRVYTNREILDRKPHELMTPSELVQLHLDNLEFEENVQGTFTVPEDSDSDSEDDGTGAAPATATNVSNIPVPKATAAAARAGITQNTYPDHVGAKTTIAPPTPPPFNVFHKNQTEVDNNAFFNANSRTAATYAAAKNAARQVDAHAGRMAEAQAAAPSMAGSSTAATTQTATKTPTAQISTPHAHPATPPPKPRPSNAQLPAAPVIAPSTAPPKKTYSPSKLSQVQTMSPLEKQMAESENKENNMSLLQELHPELFHKDSIPSVYLSPEVDAWLLARAQQDVE